MGINPSVEENKRNITFNEEYDENNFIECDNDLDLYYVPRNNKFDQELNEKLKEYTCNFAHKPYTQICGSENLPFKKLLKMPWQKYDEKFIKENYRNEKTNEYIEIINKIKAKYCLFKADSQIAKYNLASMMACGFLDMGQYSIPMLLAEAKGMKHVEIIKKNYVETNYFSEE